MGSLSNLYISQSYISLLHLGSDNTASSTPTEIQDGLGNGIGVTVNSNGDVALGGILSLKRGLDITGSVTINTFVTASTQQFVNSGNQFTDNIIRITGSYDSGSDLNPSVYQIQNGWKCYGPGLGDDGATVIDNDYVPATGWRFTIDKNTAVWFGLYNFTDPNAKYYNFSVSGSEDITGSLWVRDKITVTDISASGNISASNLWIQNRIHAYEMDVTIVSSSIIFSSGSNIIGDNANEDVQLIIGRTIVTGSLEVTGSTKINGDTTITGSLKVSNDISSSTISGIGNVSLFSSSVSERIETNSSSFYNFSSSAYKNDSSSFDSRLDSLEFFSSSQYNADSSSFNSRIIINSASAWGAFQSASSYSASLSSTITTVSQSFSSSLSSVSQSFNTTINTLSTSVNSRLNTIEVRYATTGSNNFVGNQTITGSLILSSSVANDLIVIGNSIFSGSVRGIATTLTISSNTASMDLSTGNFFLLTLVSGSNTFLNPTNINPGETISLLITQPASGYGTLTYPSSLKFPTGFAYAASATSSYVDVITFISFNTSSLYSVAINNFS
jgi:hypothetical protein